jgi:hypothetical protein
MHEKGKPVFKPIKKAKRTHPANHPLNYLNCRDLCRIANIHFKNFHFFRKSRAKEDSQVGRVYALAYTGASMVLLPGYVDRTSGLPDGIFSNQKSQFGKILEGLGMENFNILYIWPFGIPIIQPFGTFYAMW